MRWAVGALTLLLAATPTPVRWDDIAAPLQPLLRARGVERDTFPMHLEEVRRRNRSRLREGDLDHLVYYTLQSTAFTSLPPIEPAVSATQFLAGRVVPPAVRARIDAFVRAAALNPVNERMMYFRDILRREATGAEWSQTFLVSQYIRAMQFFSEKGSYQERGFSTDTAIEAGYVVHLGLATLRKLEPERRIRRVLIVGPGFDMAPRTGLVEAGAPRSYQPFAVLDSLLGLGLSRRDEIEVLAVDINPRVVQWIRRARGTEPRLPVLSGVNEIGGVRMTDDYRAYVAASGAAIGTEAPLRTVPAGHTGKSITLDAEVTNAVDAIEQDVVTERLDQRFDLVVVTNVFPYLSDADLLLAMSNVADMLAPGGVLLHNEPRPLLADACHALGFPLIHSRSAVIATVEGRPPVYDAVWMHRAPD